MSKRKLSFLLILSVFLLIAVNYNFLDKQIEGFLLENENVNVVRVVDGDTIKTSDNETIRLLGINSPERGELYYREAKDFLTDLLTNKTIKLEFGARKYDKYKRVLAYVFLDKNINLEMVQKGYANIYILNDRKYENELREAWKECIRKDVNLCEKSKNKCSGCIELKEFNNKNQKIVFYNKCDFDCSLKNWILKGEGRKKFKFENLVLKKGAKLSVILGEGLNNETTIFWNEENVWTKTGDTIFLRDEEEKLILWREINR